jgi:1-aminocyclopropane-1-carboxylate deaminase/D-cysteine desulfhydrase-like pyridoxal-dependent ACC family enzyme
MQLNTIIQTDVLKDERFEKKKLEVAVARLDLLHPVVSGNKYFKLKYNIQEALNNGKEGILTFGGAYSNHLAATAFACKEAGLSSWAVVRGESPAALSHTLIFCKEMGMHLSFVSRLDYSNKEKLYHEQQSNHSSLYLVPEGGDNEAGVRGCKEILSNIPQAQEYTHILCDIGTGTTFKGIAQSSGSHQTVVGIVILKGAIAMNKALTVTPNIHILHDYHLGGYAKKTDELIAFMNRFYRQHKIPSDFVYTGKLFWALEDLIDKNYFPTGSKILCMHTGGIQGNRSLPAGLLIF